MILSMMMCMVLCWIDFPVRDTLPEAEESAAYAETKAGPATLVVFWNLENFFDWEDGGTGESDRDFTPGGLRHWTATKFYRKANLAAKALFWL